MVTRSMILGVVVLLNAGLVARPATAQDGEARARDLFFAGHEAADRGDHATACAKFGESLELFRRVSTLLNLGKCSEGLDDITSALRYWTEGAALLEPNDPRMKLAKERIAALDARVPSLSIQLPSPLPNGAAVIVDDAPRAPGDLEGMRVAPGTHRVALRAPGHEPTEETFDLAEGEQRRIALELGAPLSAPRPTTTMVPTREPDSLSGLQIGGIAVAAVGVTGIAIGAITGGLVLSRKSTVEESCADDVCVDQAGVDAASTGRTLATVSTVGFIAGGATLTAGILMLVLGGDDAPDEAVTARVNVGPEAAGLTVVGHW